MFKQRKNKRFKYKPRFGEELSKTKLDELSRGWEKLSSDTKGKRKSGLSVIWLIVVLFLVLFLMYYLETKS